MKLHQLQSLADEGLLFGLLDACDEPAVPKRCQEMTPDRAISLYKGKAQEEYAHIAPYIAHLDSEDVTWIVEKLWSAPWGYFVFSHASLGDLRSHFRRYLTVKLPNGSEALFRFYDPRVLNTFLKASTPEERSAFCAPVRAFAVSNPGNLESVSVWRP